jgi:hypothetical protein
MCACKLMYVFTYVLSGVNTDSSLRFAANEVNILQCNVNQLNGMKVRLPA